MSSASGTSAMGPLIDNTKGEMTTGSNGSKSLTVLNIFAFVIITGLYFGVWGKPTLTLDILENPESYKEYKQRSYYMLICYFIVTVLVQFGMGVGTMNMNCPNSNPMNNASIAAQWTFIPWIFIFGIMMIALIAFPGFKSAFSNIFGYFWISGKANQLLSELLISKGFEKDTKAIQSANPGAKLQTSQLDEQGVQDLQEAIVKLFGNMSVLVNKIVPDNFESFWGLLVPVMKQKWREQNNQYVNRTDSSKNPGLTPEQLETIEAQNKTAFGELRSKKEELLKLVVSRDDVGEGFWYGYTAILVITMVQYFLSTVDCKTDPEAMQDEYKAFLTKEKDNLAATSASGAIKYTV